MSIKNVSGRVRTVGSDIDLNVWLVPWMWALVIYALTVLKVGAWKRELTYRIGNARVELFLVNTHNADAVTLAAEHNAAIQASWDVTTLASYEQAKQERVAHLSGHARKQAKAMLAIEYGLDPVVYQ